MFDSSSLDNALALAFSFASVGFDAAIRGVKSLSFITGVRPEVIGAGIAGSLIFILTLMVLLRKAAKLQRLRHAIPQAWPSPEFGLNTVPHTPHQITIPSPIFGAPRHVEKERLELVDQLNEHVQKNFSEASSEPSRRNAALSRHPNVWHLWQAVSFPILNLAHTVVIKSTTQVTALIDRSVSHVQARLHFFPTARTKARCSRCHWQRVAREGLVDHVVSGLGWYPWQCKQCLKCSYFRRRRQT